MGKPNFGIEFTAEAVRTQRLINQLPERMQHVMPMMVYLSADFVRRFVQSKIPRTQGYRAYRRALEVSRVRGRKDAFSIQIDTHNPLVKKVKPGGVLLNVYPKQRMARPDPAVLILQKYNPWTFESLPFKPDARVGVVVSSKASAREVATITKQRLKQRIKWRAELSKVGYRGTRSGSALKVSPQITGKVPSASLDAIKLEFGMGGAQPKPAWRLGLGHLKRSGMRAFTRDQKHFVLPLTRWSSTAWRKWPPRVRHATPLAQAKQYAAFQRQLGVPVNR